MMSLNKGGRKVEGKRTGEERKKRGGEREYREGRGRNGDGMGGEWKERGVEG